MKRLFYTIMAAAALAMGIASCSSEGTTWEKYEDWRNKNLEWFAKQQERTNPDGTPYYTVRVAPWNPKAYVLIHYYNDRELTEGNLSPLYNSVVSMKYIGRLYDGTPFDSTYTKADSVIRFSPSSVIDGFAIAMTDMRVGDSCRVLIPYQQGYGSSTTMTDIPPYSALDFDMKMVDIVDYEIRP